MIVTRYHSFVIKGKCTFDREDEKSIALTKATASLQSRTLLRNKRFSDNLIGFGGNDW